MWFNRAALRRSGTTPPPRLQRRAPSMRRRRTRPRARHGRDRAHSRPGEWTPSPGRRQSRGPPQCREGGSGRPARPQIVSRVRDLFYCSSILKSGLVPPRPRGRQTGRGTEPGGRPPCRQRARGEDARAKPPGCASEARAGPVVVKKCPRKAARRPRARRPAGGMREGYWPDAQGGGTGAGRRARTIAEAAPGCKPPPKTSRTGGRAGGGEG